MGFCMELEGHLIPPDEWRRRYGEMPPECRRVVDDPRPGAPVGIGRKDGKGWFVLCSGQGPFVAWAEWDANDRGPSNEGGPTPCP